METSKLGLQLIPCRRCLSRVPPETMACPYCGAPNPTHFQARRRLKKLLFILGAVGVLDLLLLAYWILFRS